MHCASPVKALTPESPMDDTPCAFPDRHPMAMAGVDSDGSAWAWVRPPHVPDPYGTYSSESSASSAALKEASPASASRLRQDSWAFRAESSRSRGDVLCTDVPLAAENLQEEVFDAADSGDLRCASQANAMQAWTAVSWAPDALRRPSERQCKVPYLDEQPWRNWLSRAAADS